MRGGNARIRPVTVPILDNVQIRKSDLGSIYVTTSTEGVFSPSILNRIARSCVRITLYVARGFMSRNLQLHLIIIGFCSLSKEWEK